MDTRCFANKKLFDETYASLSEYRRNKIDSYLYDNDRYLSMGAGYLFEHGLKRLNVPQQYGSVSYGRNGKPKLKSKDWVYNFNISHSGVYAVCAYSTGEVGVDIQITSITVNDRVLRAGCTQREYAYLAGLDAEKQRSEFVRLWTIKESYMKYLGAGLAISPMELSSDMGQPVSLWLRGQKQNVFFKEYPLDGYKLTVCSGTNEFAPAFKEVKLAPSDGTSHKK